MPNPLFSSYRAGENRVTGSTLAVFERIDLQLVEELLGAATQASNRLSTVTFKNQVVEDGSTPDAIIRASFSWFFETKTVRGSYGQEGHSRDQLRTHAELLGCEPDPWLFVLTPDPVRPSWFDHLDGISEWAGDRVLWLGFRDLADAITSLLADDRRLVGEQSRFLLTELVALYEADGLLTNDDTVVVAARAAWPEYQERHVYVGQENRSFKAGVTHFGFYSDGCIQPTIARVRVHHPSVVFDRASAQKHRADGDEALGVIIDALLDDGSRTEGQAYCVLQLSGPDDLDTVQLAAKIENDTTASSGRRWAWTLGQRYTSLDRLRSGARWTSQL